MMRLLLPLLFCVIATASLRAEVEIVVGNDATGKVHEPFSVAFDPKGVLYGVEFTKANRLFRVVEGQVEFVAGVKHESNSRVPLANVHDGDDPLAAMFHGMHDLQINQQGVAFIADSFNHRVRRINLKSGHVDTFAGTGERGFAGDGGPANQAKFSVTMTAALSPDEKRISIADIGNHRTRVIDLESGEINTVSGNGKAGHPTDGAGALETPMGDTRAVTQAKDGTLYVLLRGGNALIAVKDGKVRTVVNASGKKGYSGDGGPARDAMMNGPKYVAMDQQGRVLIADAENHCIRRYDSTSETIELIAGSPTKPGDGIGATLRETSLRRPHGVRIGPDGKLYICDTYNDRVLRSEYPNE